MSLLSGRLAGVAVILIATAGPAAALTGLPLSGAYFIYTTQAGNVDRSTGLLVEGGQIYQNAGGYAYGDSYTQITGLTTPTTATSTLIGQNSDVSLHIRATATAAPDLGTTNRSFALAETNLIFNLEVNGPDGAYVPVNLRAVFSQSGQTDPNPANGFGIFGQATAFGQIQIGGVGGGGSTASADYYLFDTCGFPGCTGSFTTSLNEVLMLPTNTLFQVDEAVLANAAVLATGEQLTSTITADPTFYIPNSYLQTHPGVTLSSSPNITAAIVPEPANWSLMLLGVGLSGAMLRRRRTAAVARN